MNAQAPSLLVPLLVNGVIIGLLYGVVAMCFVLIFKASQVVNFAQGELLLVGAWVCWWLLTRHQVPFLWAFLITQVFMMLLGVLIQVVLLRPMIGEPVISVIMITIGLSIFLQALMKWLFGVFAQPFPPVFAVKTVDFLGLTIETAYITSAAVCLIVMSGFAWFFKYSREGLAMRATAFSQQVAQSLGIPVRRIFALSWATTLPLRPTARGSCHSRTAQSLRGLPGVTSRRRRTTKCLAEPNLSWPGQPRTFSSWSRIQKRTSRPAGGDLLISIKTVNRARRRL